MVDHLAAFRTVLYLGVDMKKMILTSLTLLISSSVFSQTINTNNSEMLISSKTCNGANLELSGNERVKFGNSQIAFYDRASEDDSQVCNRVTGYMRLLISSVTINNQQTEQYELMGKVQRIACYRKPSKEVISDETSSPKDNSPNVQAVLNTSAAFKTLTLKGHEQCLTGELVLQLAESNTAAPSIQGVWKLSAEGGSIGIGVTPYLTIGANEVTLSNVCSSVLSDSAIASVTVKATISNNQITILEKKKAKIKKDGLKCTVEINKTTFNFALTDDGKNFNYLNSDGSINSALGGGKRVKQIGDLF